MEVEKFEGELPAGLQMEDDAQLDLSQSSFSDYAPAIFQRESDIAGFFAGEDMPEATPEEERAWRTGQWSAFEYNDSTGSEFAKAAPLQNGYAGLKSPGQVDWKNRENARLKLATQYSMDVPWYKSLPIETAGGIVSVTTAGEVAYGAWKVPKAIAENVLKRAIRYAGGTVAMSGMQEYILGSQQGREHRSYTESGATILGSAAVGGVIGGVLGKSAGKDVAEEVDQIVADADMINTNINTLHTQTKSGGAAEVDFRTKLEDIHAIEANDDLTPAAKAVAINELKGEDSKMSKGWFMMGKYNPLNVLSKALPDMRLKLSDSTEARNAGDDLAAMNIITEGNVRGKGNVSLDAVRDTYERQVQGNLQKVFVKGYTDYTKGKDFGTTGKMSQQDFNHEVRNALTSGLEHDNKHVLNSAGLLYESTVLPLGRRLVKAGQLKGDVSGNPLPPMGDELWMPRMHSREFALDMPRESYVDAYLPAHNKALERNAAKEIEERAELKAESESIHNELASRKADLQKSLDESSARKEKPDMRRDARAELKSVNADLKKATAELKKVNSKKANPHLTALEASKTVKGAEKTRDFYRDMHSTITATGDGVTEFSGMGVMTDRNGQLVMTEGRTVISATANLPKEALDDNIIMGLQNVLNRQNSQLLVHEDFRFGDATFGNRLDALNVERENKITLMTEQGASQKQRNALNKKYKKYDSDMRQLFKAFYNIKDPVEHQGLRDLGANIKALTVMQGLGSVMLSASPEIAAGISTVGIAGYVRHAVATVMNNKAMRDLSKVQQAEYYTGMQIDTVARMAEHGVYDAGAGKVSRGLHRGADFAVDKLFGLGYWTRGITRQVGVATQSKIGRLLLKANVAEDGTISGLSKTDMIDMARIGMGEDVIRLAKIEVEAHSNKLAGGVIDINAAGWGNQAVATEVKNAISQEVHNVIIKPGTGSTPFIGRSMVGSMFLQFKQFILASTSKYMIADMQRFLHGDVRAMEKQAAFLLLGTLQWEVRRRMYGIEDEEESWFDKVKAGFAYGGGGGIATDMYSYADQLVGSGANARFRGNKDLFSGLGPWAKTVKDLAVTASGAANLIKNGELSNEQIRATRQSIPGNTFLPVREQFNRIEEHAKDVYN